MRTSIYKKKKKINDNFNLHKTFSGINLLFHNQVFLPKKLYILGDI